MTTPASPADIIARSMWQSGNDRIGHRDFDAPGVGEVYRDESQTVLAALTEAGYTIVRTDDLRHVWAIAETKDPACSQCQRLREALGD